MGPESLASAPGSGCVLPPLPWSEPSAHPCRGNPQPLAIYRSATFTMGHGLVSPARPGTKEALLDRQRLATSLLWMGLSLIALGNVATFFSSGFPFSQPGFQSSSIFSSWGYVGATFLRAAGWLLVTIGAAMKAFPCLAQHLKKSNNKNSHASRYGRTSRSRGVARWSRRGG